MRRLRSLRRKHTRTPTVRLLPSRNDADGHREAALKRSTRATEKGRAESSQTATNADHKKRWSAPLGRERMLCANHRPQKTMVCATTLEANSLRDEPLVATCSAPPIS